MERGVSPGKAQDFGTLQLAIPSLSPKDKIMCLSRQPAPGGKALLSLSISTHKIQQLLVHIVKASLKQQGCIEMSSLSQAGRDESYSQPGQWATGRGRCA